MTDIALNKGSNMTKEEKVHDPSLPRWVFLVAISIIVSALAGLYTGKPNNSELSAVKEIAIESKQDIKELNQCLNQTNNTLTRLETILVRLEKKVDKE